MIRSDNRLNCEERDRTYWDGRSDGSQGLGQFNQNEEITLKMCKENILKGMKTCTARSVFNQNCRSFHSRMMTQTVQAGQGELYDFELDFCPKD